MAIYWVNYDLKTPGQNYNALLGYLESRQDCKKVLKSSFFVRTQLTSAQLRDEIIKRIDSNDQVIVVEVKKGGGWANHGLSPEVRAWMKKNISNS